MTTFAVVIPTKNEARSLGGLLAAIARQTVRPSHVIVADAQSTDATRDIARAFGARVVDGGLPGAGRNAGARADASDMIFFLDADVTLPSDHFFAETIGEFEKRNLDLACPDVGLVGGNMFDALSVRFYNAYVRLWGGRHPHPTGFAMLVRRNVHEAIGGFNEAVKFAEDHDYGLRVRDAGFVFGILHTAPILVTTRRQERDGRLRMTLVYVLAEVYMMLFGPITSDIFRYRFGHDEHTRPKKSDVVS